MCQYNIQWDENALLQALAASEADQASVEEQPNVVQQAAAPEEISKNVMAPQIEVLALLESFIRLKGELIRRFYALFYDNADLIRDVGNFIFNKLDRLQSFTLRGITVFRHILEFALRQIGEWHVNKYIDSTTEKPRMAVNTKLYNPFVR